MANERYKKSDFVLVPSIKALKGIDPVAQVIYMWLAYHSDYETGECFPSYTILSEETGYSKPTLIKGIRILQNNKLIKKIQRRKENSKENTSNLYVLLTILGGKENLPGGKGDLPGGKGDLLPPSKKYLPGGKGGLPELESDNYNHSFNNNQITIKSSSKEAEEIIDYFNNKFSRQYRLTPDRNKKIKLRLKSYSLDEIKKAIDNLKQSKFHNGENDRGWIATIDFIIRNDEKIDEFLNSKQASENYYKNFNIE